DHVPVAVQDCAADGDQLILARELILLQLFSRSGGPHNSYLLPPSPFSHSLTSAQLRRPFGTGKRRFSSWSCERIVPATLRPQRWHTEWTRYESRPTRSTRRGRKSCLPRYRTLPNAICSLAAHLMTIIPPSAGYRSRCGRSTSSA